MSDLTPAGKPKPNVKLVGEDGNAYAIMGRVVAGLKRTDPPHTEEDIALYREQSTSGDYNNLIRVAIEWSEDRTEVNDS